LFALGLGHQLLALAAGAKTFRPNHGHRGANQPVRCLETGKVYITSQNHGYAVDISGAEGFTETFVNANDGANEGFELSGYKAFAAQFCPEDVSGPMNTKWLFDKFIERMEIKCH